MDLTPTPDIERRLATLQDTIRREAPCPDKVRFVAVTKGHPFQVVHTLYSLGVRDFGENYLQELNHKKKACPYKDVSWHFIGNIQSKKLMGIFQNPWVHSIGSSKILSMVLKSVGTGGQGTTGPFFLLQTKVFPDDKRPFGFFIGELESIIEAHHLWDNHQWAGFSSIGLPEKTAHETQSAYFYAVAVFKELWQKFQPHSKAQEPIISLGMSSDYPLALRAGSNLIRIGTALLGPRK